MGEQERVMVHSSQVLARTAVTAGPAMQEGLGNWNTLREGAMGKLSSHGRLWEEGVGVTGVACSEGSNFIVVLSANLLAYL